MNIIDNLLSDIAIAVKIARNDYEVNGEIPNDASLVFVASESHVSYTQKNVTEKHISLASREELNGWMKKIIAASEKNILSGLDAVQEFQKEFITKLVFELMSHGGRNYMFCGENFIPYFSVFGETTEHDCIDKHGKMARLKSENNSVTNFYRL